MVTHIQDLKLYKVICAGDRSQTIFSTSSTVFPFKSKASWERHDRVITYFYNIVAGSAVKFAFFCKSPVDIRTLYTGFIVVSLKRRICAHVYTVNFLNRYKMVKQVSAVTAIFFRY